MRLESRGFTPTPNKNNQEKIIFTHRGNQVWGFTLFELLIVVTIIGILAATVIVVVNPGKQLANARNAQRQSHLLGMINILYEYSIDNRGRFPAPVPTVPTVIGSGTGQVNFCYNLVPNYITGMPYDPIDPNAIYNGCGDYNSGYLVVQNLTTGRITLSAPSAERGAKIEVTL